MKYTALEPSFGPLRRCLVCGSLLFVIPTIFGDAACPRCGSFLWANGPQAQQQADVIEHLLSLGGSVTSDPCTNEWAIDLSGTSCSDREISLMLDLEQIDELFLSGTDISNSALSSIVQMSSLEVLELDNTAPTNLELLGKLTGLQMLSLAGTKISDTALGAFRDCRDMWCLDLDNTSICGVGLDALTHLPLEWVFLSGTQFSDGHIEILKKFPYLERLELSDTQMTLTGIANLRRQHPGCEILVDI